MNVRPLTGAAVDYDDLPELIGAARLVLIGEASHGTHEFYRERRGHPHRPHARGEPPETYPTAL